MRKLLIPALACALAFAFATPGFAYTSGFTTFTFDDAPVLADSQTVGAWYVDRYRPHDFDSVVFDGDARLRVGISAEDSSTGRPLAQSGPFYNTQGRKIDVWTGPDTSISGDLYIGTDWAGTSVATRRSDLWATMFAEPDRVTPTAYPTFGFINTVGFRAFAQDGSGWHVIGFPEGFTYGRWYNLRIELAGSPGGGVTPTVLRYYIDDKLVWTDETDTGSTLFGNLMIQAYNFGDTYDVYWDNVAAQPVTPHTTSNIDDAWHDPSFTVQLSATDGGMGVADTYYRYKDGPTQHYDGAFDVTDEGQTTVEYWSVGTEGYVEPVQRGTVKVDRSAPVTTDDHKASYVGNAVATLTPTDAGSGVSATYYELDGAPAVTGTAIATAQLGSHTLRYWSVDALGHVEQAHTVTFAVVAALKPVARLGGANRYDVGIAAATDAFPSGFAGVTDLVLASGEDRAAPDVLTAAGLAGVYDAPLMLVPFASVPASLKASIASMPAGLRVHVVGGPRSVSPAVLAELRTVASVASVERVDGADRYEVAANVARRMRAELGAGMPATALVANGDRTSALGDALTASAVSTRKHIPVLLVRAGSVPLATRAALTQLGLDRRYVVGGPASVSERVRTSLGVAPADRIAGANRYAVAANLASRAKAEGWLSNPELGFAAKLPDAVTGGAYMGKRDGALLYVTATGVPAETASFISANKAGVMGGHVFGGEKSVPEPVRQRLQSLMNE